VQYVNWSDKFLTGNESIDTDHRKLFSLIGDLYGYVQIEDATNELDIAITELVDYVHAHFEREEQLMAAAAYPDLDSHKEEHRKLQKRVLDYMASYRADPLAFDLDEFMEFLISWLKNHILKSDMAYVPYLLRETKET